MRGRNLLPLIGLRMRLSFLTVIIGALLFSDMWDFALVKSLFILYITFDVLFYNGIYMMNDIADVKEDAKHPLKKSRLLPSKKISLRFAIIYSIAFTILGLITTYLLFRKEIFFILLMFLMVNVIYTFISKKIPYVEFLTSSLTHPLRLLLGAFIVSDIIPYKLMLGVFFVAIGLSVGKFIVEKDTGKNKGRITLKSYKRKSLITIEIISFVLLLTLAAVDFGNYIIVYLIMIAAYVIFGFGYFYSKTIKKFLKKAHS